MMNHRLLATLVCHVPLLLGGSLLVGGCSMPSVPHVLGLGSYYAVTDTAGRIYYTDSLARESRGSIEFRDGTTGAWVSLPGGSVKKINEAEFRAGKAR
ncbi:MAG: hypothetical protein ABI661_06300 [Gammaproteobacteria bacterium]